MQMVILCYVPSWTANFYLPVSYFSIYLARIETDLKGYYSRDSLSRRSKGAIRLLNRPILTSELPYAPQRHKNFIAFVPDISEL